jgi:hypothetical protein
VGGWGGGSITHALAAWQAPTPASTPSHRPSQNTNPMHTHAHTRTAVPKPHPRAQRAECDPIARRAARQASSGIGRGAEGEEAGRMNVLRAPRVPGQDLSNTHAQEVRRGAGAAGVRGHAKV